MITKFEEEAELKGCRKIVLTTDYSNNDDAIVFYKKRGYGDVGAVSAAFIIVFLLGLLMLQTGDLTYILLLTVYVH